jgi:hypothetical protein
MKHILPILALTLTLYNCTRTTPQRAYNRDSLVAVIRDSLAQEYVDSVDLYDALANQRIVIEHIPKFEQNWNRARTVMVPKALVYASNRPGAKVIDTLRLGTPVRLVGEPKEGYVDVSGDPSVYGEPQYWHVLVGDSIPGYVKFTDVASHGFGYRGYDPWILMGDGPRKAGQYCMKVVSCAEKSEYPLRPPYMKEEFQFFYSAGPNKNVQQIGALALKDLPLGYLFHANNGNDCPNSQESHLIVQIKGKFQDLLQGYAKLEGKHYERTTFYLPVKFDNGKVLLIEEGDQYNAFNLQETRLNAFEYNNTIGIPITQLVVVEEESGDYFEDANGHFVYDEKGHLKKNVSLHSVKYYRWNGEKIKLAQQSH